MIGAAKLRSTAALLLLLATVTTLMVLQGSKRQMRREEGIQPKIAHTPPPPAPPQEPIPMQPPDINHGNFDVNKLAFIKIPKAGSTTMGKMLMAVGKKNRVGWRNCQMKFTRMYIEGMEGLLLRKLFRASVFSPEKPGYLCEHDSLTSSEWASRGAITGHFRFLNFEDLGEKNPLWLATIREPTDKYVSMYSWLRGQSWAFGHYMTSTGKGSGETRSSWMNRTVDECVQRQYPECRMEKHITFAEMNIGYFCGLDSFCHLLGSETALQKAKHNIEKYFPVVGVLEMLKETLAVFEYFLPQYFTGLSKQPIIQENSSSSTAHPISNSTLTFFRRVFDKEYELREVLVQRLQAQFDRIPKGKRRSLLHE